MDPATIKATLQILALGVSVAQSAWRFISELRRGKTSGAEQSRAPTAPSISESTQELERLLVSSCDSIKKAVDLAADRVINKLEQDKMEELASRLKNLQMLLAVKKTQETFMYALQVRESVEYARNRVEEGKRHWMMPYTVGASMLAATFRCVGEENPEIERELDGVMRETRDFILDELAACLIEHQQRLPWDSVRDVLNDKDGAIAALVESLPEGAAPAARPRTPAARPKKQTQRAKAKKAKKAGKKPPAGPTSSFTF